MSTSGETGQRFAPVARAVVRDLEQSKVRIVANAGLGRADVLPFWFGEGDEATAPGIREAAIEALADGRTFYTHNLGVPSLRQALAGYLEQLHGRAIGVERVCVSSSGVSALMVSMQAVIDPGDRVVAVTPVWPNIVEIPKILGAQVTRVGLEVRQGRWRLDLDKLLAAITPGTRLVLLNSPGNPSGWVLPAEDRAPLLEHCRRLGAWLLTDDVYERLAYDPGLESAPSFLPIADPEDRLISTNSFSKAWRMTGWRLGWIVAPAAMTEDLGKLLEFNTSCAPDFVQAGALAALASGEAPIAALRAEQRGKRDRLVAGLSKLPGVTAATPDGGLYVLFQVAGHEDSVALARRLIEEAGLGLAPGAAFGDESEGWLRWCFCVADERLDEGLRRLGAWLERQGVR